MAFLVRHSSLNYREFKTNKLVGEVMDLVSALPADILRLSIMSDETAGEEEDMGVYHDDMD